MNKLILIRGLPGSGKSTLAKNMLGCVHVEADMFHYRGDIYDWKPENVKASHEWCLNAATYLLASGANVVVSNTFTRRWEMDGYLTAAKACGATVLILTATGEWDNIHGVPKETIFKMKERWEE